MLWLRCRLLEISDLHGDDTIKKLPPPWERVTIGRPLSKAAPAPAGQLLPSSRKAGSDWEPFAGKRAWSRGIARGRVVGGLGGLGANVGARRGA